TLAAAAAVTVTVQDSLGITLATLLPPTAMPAGPVSLSWGGTAVDPGTTVPDGSVRVVVTTTDAAGMPSSSTAPIAVVRAGAVLTLSTEAGQQLLQTTFTVDLTPPRVTGLQARTHAGGGFVRFSLAEPAYVQLRVQGHLLGPYVQHRAGVGGIRYHLAGRRA